MIDRSAWEKLQRTTVRQARTDGRAEAFARLRQAAVPMERLTHSEHWDTFLRYGEAIQEQDREALRQLGERLTAAEYLSDLSLATLRHAAALLRAKLDARQELLDLPKSIVQSASPVNESNPQ